MPRGNPSKNVLEAVSQNMKMFSCTEFNLDDCCAYQVLGRQSSSIGMARILQMVLGGFREECTNEILLVCDIIFQTGVV